MITLFTHLERRYHFFTDTKSTYQRSSLIVTNSEKVYEKCFYKLSESNTRYYLGPIFRKNDNLITLINDNKILLVEDSSFISDFKDHSLKLIILNTELEKSDTLNYCIDFRLVDYLYINTPNLIVPVRPEITKNHFNRGAAYIVNDWRL